VPKIHKAMEANGSPPAIFETDQVSWLAKTGQDFKKKML
jgi:hypothetical protein